MFKISCVIACELCGGRVGKLNVKVLTHKILKHVVGSDMFRFVVNHPHGAFHVYKTTVISCRSLIFCQRVSCAPATKQQAQDTLRKCQCFTVNYCGFTKMEMLPEDGSS